MRLGVSSYTFTWGIGIEGFEKPPKPLSVFDLLEKAKELEVEVLQICDNIPLSQLDEDTIRQLEIKSKEYGIALEFGTRGLDEDNIYKYIDICRYCKAKILRTILIGSEFHDLDITVERLKSFIPLLEQNDIVMVLENHSTHTAVQLRQIIQSVNSENLGICLDTVNSFQNLECPDQVIESLIDISKNIHIKDFDIVRVNGQLGFSIFGTPAGRGKLNVPEILHRIKDADVSIVLELWTPFGSNIVDTIRTEDEWAKESIIYLKNVIKSLNTNS